MPKRRLRIQLDNGGGSRVSVSIEGRLTRDKVLKLMDMVDSLSTPEENIEEPIQMPRGNTFGKLFQVIDRKFYLGTFNSSDLLEAYEDEYGVPIKLSTVSTYLARLVERGLLTRDAENSGWMYRRIRVTVGR